MQAIQELSASLSDMFEQQPAYRCCLLFEARMSQFQSGIMIILAMNYIR